MEILDYYSIPGSITIAMGESISVDEVRKYQ
jgi:hypothetical protein